MKVDVAGVHIKGPNNIVVQHSQSQQNALALLDDDGVWVHLDINAVSMLYQFLCTPAVSVIPKQGSDSMPPNLKGNDLFS